ncbi:MAG: hypothetical protein ACK5QT_07705 [Oligoflexia bacterium]
MLKWGVAGLLQVLALVCCATGQSPLRGDSGSVRSDVGLVWLHETIRVRRADEPGNACWSVSGLRQRFFELKPEAEKCSALFSMDSKNNEPSWVLHYRLVRRPRPLLQIERFEGLNDEQKVCVAPGGALARIPIPAELAVLVVEKKDLERLLDLDAPQELSQGIPPIRVRGTKVPVSCRRIKINLKQDEIMDAKLRFPLMVVQVQSSGGPGGGHWLERLWLAPFMDPRGYSQGWLEDSVLPETPCRLCLKKAYSDSIADGRARQLETR